jgi:large conductance mechanosensitive channel
MEIGPGVKIGNFFATTLDFIIIALVIFLFVKVVNRMKRKEEAKPVGPAQVPPDVELLSEIRDILKKNSSGKVV